LGIDSSHWYPFFAEECGKINTTFDIVFSYGVLEHVRDLRQTLLGLKSVLKPGGKMIHWTVNYLIPYEPHFKMLLFPFSPKTTSFFKPSLKHSPLWGGLNFVTARKLRRACKSCALDIKFERGVVLESFQRLREAGFARRQRYFLKNRLDQCFESDSNSVYYSISHCTETPEVICSCSGVCALRRES
ncbi:MAG: methyltransferase domain-containing protein, partial [Deltaproteobacteria bacterium]|nr:methyltransferase domain-containing protein [Deltaproteobacteria bacterium]